MSATFNPELASLREKVEAQGSQIAELRGGLQQLDKIVGATTKQSVWQLIALVVSLCAAIVGGLAYQTTMIDKRIDQIDKRIEQVEKRIELSEKNMSARMDQFEKNITARFEDLKQEVRAQRK
jgi:septation ring formation regulator EzrA